MPWSRGSGRADSAFILPVHSGGTGTSAPGGRNISVCLGKGKIKKKRKRIYKTVSGCASVGVRRLKCGIFSGKFSAGSGKGNADHVPGAGPDLKGMELYDPADEDEYWSKADPGGVFRTDRSGGCQKFCYGHCDCKKERGKYGKSDPADNFSDSGEGGAESGNRNCNLRQKDGVSCHGSNSIWNDRLYDAQLSGIYGSPLSGSPGQGGHDRMSRFISGSVWNRVSYDTD